MYKILFLTVFFMNSIMATEIVFNKKQKKILKALITHAEPHDFDTFKLSNRYNNEFVVICAGNPFHNNKSSYIEYENFFGVHAADFRFKNNVSCNTFKEYLNGVFPGVNKENPIEISFNRDSGQIDFIHLPSLDSLEDGEQGEDILKLSTL
jgi:hypothetical protein